MSRPGPESLSTAECATVFSQLEVLVRKLGKSRPKWLPAGERDRGGLAMYLVCGRPAPTVGWVLNARDGEWPSNFVKYGVMRSVIRTDGRARNVHGSVWPNGEAGADLASRRVVSVALGRVRGSTYA